MDNEDRPNDFRQAVTTKDGVVKTVVARTEDELAQGVAAVEQDQAPVAPDINNPEDGNKVVSPDNKSVEEPFNAETANNAPEELPEEAPKKRSK